MRHPDREPERCHFCNNKRVYATCDWVKTEKWPPKPLSDIRWMDTVRLSDGTIYRCVHPAPLPLSNGWRYFTSSYLADCEFPAFDPKDWDIGDAENVAIFFGFGRPEKPNGRKWALHTFAIHGWAYVRERSFCNQPCCSLHRRSPGPERYYCMDHWNAWESVS